MSKDSFDKLLESAFEGDISDIKGLSDIKIPDEKYIIQKFHERTNKSTITSLCTRPSSSRGKNALKFLITAATLALVILVSSVFLSTFFDTTNVKAVKLKILHIFMQKSDVGLNVTITNKDPNDIAGQGSPGSAPTSEIPESRSEKLNMDDLTKKIKYPVIIPKYLPEGYSLKDIQLDVMPSGTSQITQTYVNKDNVHLTIIQSTDASDINGMAKAPANSTVTTATILGIEAQIISSDSSTHQVLWYNNGYKYQIIARISETELEKFIANLKYSI